MFRFAAGSYGIRILADYNYKNLIQNRPVTDEVYRYGIKRESWSVSNNNIGRGAHFIPKNQNFIQQAICPFYCSWFAVPTSLEPGLSTVSPFVNGISFALREPLDLSEFAGDDFRLMYQIGAPSVVIPAWRYLQ